MLARGPVHSARNSLRQRGAVRGRGRELRRVLAFHAVALTVSLSFAAVAAASAQASSAYVIEQRAANSTSRLILAPSGLRFDYYSPVRAGGRLRARRPKPLLGVIIRYRDARLFLLDPV